MLEQYEKNLPQGSRGLFEAEQNAGRELGNLKFLNRQIVHSVLELPFLNELSKKTSKFIHSHGGQFFQADFHKEKLLHHENEMETGKAPVFDSFNAGQEMGKTMSKLEKIFGEEILKNLNASRENLIKKDEGLGRLQLDIDKNIRFAHAEDERETGQEYLRNASAVYPEKELVAELLEQNQDLYKRQGEGTRTFVNKDKDGIKLAENGRSAEATKTILADVFSEKGNFAARFSLNIDEKLADLKRELGVSAGQFNGAGSGNVQPLLIREDNNFAQMGRAGGYPLEKESKFLSKAAAGEASNAEIGRTLLGSVGRNSFDVEKLLNKPTPSLQLPSQDLLYEPTKAGGEKAQAAAGQGIGGNKMYTIQIEGRGKVEVDGAVLKGQMLDTLVENIRPVLIDILDEEMFAESEGSYYF